MTITDRILGEDQRWKKWAVAQLLHIHIAVRDRDLSYLVSEVWVHDLEHVARSYPTAYRPLDNLDGCLSKAANCVLDLKNTQRAVDQHQCGPQHLDELERRYKFLETMANELIAEALKVIDKETYITFCLDRGFEVDWL